MRGFLLQVALGAAGLFLSLVVAREAADLSSTDSGDMVCASGNDDCVEVRDPNGFVGVPAFLAGGAATFVVVRRLGRE